MLFTSEFLDRGMSDSRIVRQRIFAAWRSVRQDIDLKRIKRAFEA